ncbi:MAG: hypothetical protein IPH78_13895 [Bacteroidetes bacterium]|nr:hypothetical protein [Bacteroidota bacterium]
MLIVQNQTPCCSVVGSDTIIQRVFVDCTPFAQSNALGETEPYIVESFATIDVLAGTCAGDTTNFLLTPSGPIINWQWNFPDSTTSTSATPSFVYYDCPPAINYTTVNLYFTRAISDYGYTEPHAPDTQSTATTTLPGGTPPYTVQWSDPQSQTTATAINLCPGNYTVTVTDGNGCTATPNPVLVTDFAFPFIGTISAGSTILCYGDYGGSAVLNMTGGTLPYAFFWANGVTDSSVTGLQGGNTNVTATDGHGCVFVGTAFIWQPDEIGANITTTNAACGLCNGSANAEGTGGHYLSITPG